jgi:hypothetical protein
MIPEFLVYRPPRGRSSKIAEIHRPRAYVASVEIEDPGLPRKHATRNVCHNEHSADELRITRPV